MSGAQSDQELLTGETSPRIEGAPRHVAFIMDGNGRWAAERGQERIQGHREGVKAARRAVETCARHGVEYVTLFAFSTENWKREAAEVDALMGLFHYYLDHELQELVKNGVRLIPLGDVDRLDPQIQKSLKRVTEETASHDRINLVLAISYGGREEIVSAARELVRRACRGEVSPDQVTHDMFASCMWSAGIPEPDLLIRTSGEFRISNFLLWQLAYTEIVVSDKLWPDLQQGDIEDYLREYAKRERRFGLSGQQIKGMRSLAGAG